MRCEEARELLLDAVYGEDLSLDESVRFFRHLDDCEECSGEHRELVGARALLAQWDVEDDVAEAIQTPLAGPEWSGRGWQLAQKAAVVFLVAAGAFAMLQHMGVWSPPGRVAVSERQLAEMVHDLILAGQEENWRVIGRALLEAKEDMEVRSRVQMDLVSQEVQGLETRFVTALEENNRQIRTLANQE